MSRGIGVAYVVVAGVWALLVMASFLKFRWCIVVFRTLIVFGVFMVLVTWWFTALVLGLALVTGDACYRPEQTAAALLNASPPPTPKMDVLNSVEASLYYYTSCDLVRDAAASSLP